MKILFISHDASRSGGPILLRNFIQWLNQNTSHKSHLILRVGGVLEPDFKEIVNYDLFYPKYYNHYPTLSKRTLNRFGWYKWKLKNYHNDLLNQLRKKKFDILYSNTVVNNDVLNIVRQLNIPILTHVRELESTIEHFGGKKLINKLNSLCNHFIADSYSVKQNLIEKHNIKGSKIDVVHEYVQIPENLPDKTISANLRKQLNIPSDAFIVGASGGGLWRKGYDLFIQTAIATCAQKEHKNTYFIWVGGFNKEKEFEINYDLEKAGLKNNVLFVGAQKKPLDYFSLFDIFILASREEPFGIVGMESALFNTPVICFENSGGMPEFITNNCGIAVPYLNIPKLVDAINIFKNNADKKREFGINAKNKVISNHTINTKAKEILKVMEKII